MGSLRRLVARGRQFDVCGIVSDSGRCKVEEFLRSDLKSNPDARERAVALFQVIAENGIEELGPQKCERLRGGVIELKVQADGLRFFGFLDAERRSLLVLERGWKKGPKKEQDRQIDEVIKFKNSYVPRQWPME